MPRFMLELQPAQASGDSNGHAPVKPEDTEAAVRRLLDAVGATSADLLWAVEDVSCRIFLRYESSHLVSAGVRNQLSSELSLEVVHDYRMFTSEEFALEQSASTT